MRERITETKKINLFMFNVDENYFPSVRIISGKIEKMSGKQTKGLNFIPDEPVNGEDNKILYKINGDMYSDTTIFNPSVPMYLQTDEVMSVYEYQGHVHTYYMLSENRNLENFFDTLRKHIAEELSLYSFVNDYLGIIDQAKENLEGPISEEALNAPDGEFSFMVKSASSRYKSAPAAIDLDEDEVER